MKICLVGPGIMPIPPTGWGAVEILVWDYKHFLEKEGHEVRIVNTRDKNQIIREVESFNPDFVHVHYDEFIDVANHLSGRWKVAITSHFGYLDQPNHPMFQPYRHFFNQFINTGAFIFALSPSIKNTYIQHGANPNKIFVTPNGVRTDLFKYNESPEFDRSIYLAKIDYRKRQHIFQYLSNLYFAGNIADNRFNNSSQYLGEWSKEFLYENLTKYGNLVLLSDGEAHPLVCMEAMTAGLGLVISQYATANLDLSKPFIDVITEDKVGNLQYVSNVIESNRQKSISIRKEIVKYVCDNFSYEVITKRYLNIIESL